VTDEIEEKTERMVDMLVREGLGGVLLNAQHNFAWLTGGASNGIDLSRENGVAFLLVRADGKRYMLANNIEMPRLMAEEISAGDFEPVEYSWQDEKASGDFVTGKALSLLANGGELATDISIDGRTRAIEGLVAKCRYSLTAAEIERFGALGRDAGIAMRRVLDKVVPGETEIEIATNLRAELAAGGMTSVVTLVAADERIASFRHPVPSENRWDKTLLIVSCSKRDGLISSCSRIACIGNVPEELQRRTEATAFVNASLWNATRPGLSGADLYRICADAYAEQGFPDEINKHHQGGAGGYKTREWVAHPNSAEIVQQNQAFAWNPSITGTKVEETMIISETGVEVITTSPDFPSIETEIDGQTYISPGILSI
jgi:Xaa-Pro aminopeptidase